MFFGAGNVIFPPYLGLQSGTHWAGGFAAYYFADVLLALFALFELIREGSIERVLDRIGRKRAEILMTVISLPLSTVDMNWVLPALIFGLGGFIYRLPWLEREQTEDE